jgi:Ca2+-binding RTX toxin-like protein
MGDCKRHGVKDEGCELGVDEANPSQLKYVDVSAIRREPDHQQPDHNQELHARPEWNHAARALHHLDRHAGYHPRTIVGDFQPLDTDLVEAGVQIGYDDLGNVIQDPQSPGDRSDLLNGSGNNDQMNGGALRDRLTALGGSDILIGEAMAMS